MFLINGTLSASLPFLWKTYDGWVEMASGDFVDLITAYETYVEDLFTREAILAAQVQAAQTVPDVDAIEW